MNSIHFNRLTRLTITLLFSILGVQLMLASIVYSKQNGAWSSASTWELNHVPLPNDFVVIKEGHTITHTGAFIRNANLDVLGTLVLTNNVARTFTALSIVAILGELRVEAGSAGFAGKVYGNGLYRQMGGTAHFSGEYDVRSTDLQGGSASFNSSHSVQFGYLVLKNATIDDESGQGEFYVNIEFSWLDQGHVSINTSLTVQAGAFLQFAASSTFKNSGVVKNRGSAHASNGILTKGSGSIHLFLNYGLWEIDVPAGKYFSVNKQDIDNRPGGSIVKKGSGGLVFNNDAEFQTYFGDNTFHVQSGTCAMTVPALYPQNGLWQVDAGAVLLFNPSSTSDVIKFKGPRFINNGEVKGVATLQFSDDEDMIMEGSGQYANVEINKAGGSDVILYSTTQITTTFTLTSGRIVLNQYDLRLGTAQLFHANNPDSYIQTNGLGSCVRYCAAGGYLQFPVGKNAITIFFFQMEGGAADNIKVRVLDSFYAEYIGVNAACNEQIPLGVVGHNWLVEEQIPGGTIASVVAAWLPDAERQEFDRSQCTLGRYAGGNWQPNTFSAADAPSPFFSVFASNVTILGLFGVFSAGHETDLNFVAPNPAASAPLCEWDDLQLYANTTPHAEVIWSGPNAYHSSASNPIIPGIQLFQAGTYTISAAQFGCPALQASVNVQVNPAPNAVITGPTQVQKGETVVLSAEGGIAYVWSNGATTQNILVSPLQTTSYQVTVSNISGCSEVAVHTITVEESTPVTEVIAETYPLKITPNPSTENATLTFESATAGNAQWVLTDSRGVIHASQNIKTLMGQNQMIIPLANVSAGTYHVSLIQNNEVKTTRLVKLMGE